MRVLIAREFFFPASLVLICTASQAFKPPPVSKEFGCSPTLSFVFGRRDYDENPFYFDPFGIATDTNFGRLRESELKAGRIAMLATLETILVPVLKAQQKESDWIPDDFPTGGVLESIKTLTVEDYAKVVVTCGILELVVFVQRNPQAMPGDYGIGYFGLVDKGAHERSLLAELENGRLAMMAFVAKIVLEKYGDGEAWDEQLLALIRKWIG